jgi:hypothetical protein
MCDSDGDWTARRALTDGNRRYQRRCWWLVMWWPQAALPVVIADDVDQVTLEDAACAKGTYHSNGVPRCRR